MLGGVIPDHGVRGIKRFFNDSSHPECEISTPGQLLYRRQVVMNARVSVGVIICGTRKVGFLVSRIPGQKAYEGGSFGYAQLPGRRLSQPLLPGGERKMHRRAGR